MNSEERLAQLILEDRFRATPTTAGGPTECFLCGRGFLYRGSRGDDSGRFCGKNCLTAYDAGFRQSEIDVHEVPLRSWIGLEQLNDDLKAQRARVEHRIGKIPDEELARAPRRCELCGDRIPVWFKGVKVSAQRKRCLACSPRR